ncbi:MAG: endonuclease/exonuclease/phosphatase family protein [Sediminibacterium sp.]|nr:endonuclease/exonuclease/phosphatase family protein [Sediminibacterium sp.]
MVTERFRHISFGELRKLVDLRASRQLSGFNRLVLWLNYFVIIALILSVVAKYISPQLFWFIAFFGLAFPVITLLNFLFIIYWVMLGKRTVIFSIIAMVIALPGTLRFIQISWPSKQAASLKVTSYNSMLFDLYNWTKNKDSRNLILTGLSEINSDVLCLQEFYNSEEEGDFHNTDTLTQLLNLNYHHTEYSTTLRNTDHWGIAIFSKYPIINKGKILFNTKSNNLCIYSDIVIRKDTVRIYNIHLQSISFSKSDTKFLKDVISEQDAKDEVENGKSILRRIKRAFIKRAEQVQMIKASMATCPYRIILCGDFNDTPASYAYEQLCNELNDSFVEKGLGFGRTYAGAWPQFRIDYILHSPEIKCLQFKRQDETVTDHFPITAYFDL